MIARSLARLLVNRPKTVLIVYTLITLLIATQIPNLYMQSDLSGFLPADDPSIQLWKKINDDFEIGSTIVIYVTADDIRTPDVLKEMDYIETKLNYYEYDDGKNDGIFTIQSVSSLIKAENAKIALPEGLGGTGRKEIPADINLIYTYWARQSVQMMKGTLYTDANNVTVIIIQLGENADYQNILHAAKTAIKDFAPRYCKMTLTGGIAVQSAMSEKVFESLNIVFILAIVLVAINIYLFHRNIKSYAICFLPLAFSIVLTFGVLGIVHPQLTILSIAAVALLIGLGDDYAVYYSGRFAEEYSEDDKIKCIEKTFKSTGKAVLMCAAATMIGFGSLMTSNMPPLVAFGFTCLLGTAFVFLSATILVPCLCLILKYKKHETSHQWKRFANFIVNQRKRLFILGCFFVIISLITLPQVKTDVDLYSMAPKGIPEVEMLTEYSQNFGGGTNFNAILIETDYQGLTHREVIDAIYNMELEIRDVGASAFSVADELKKINDMLENAILENLSKYLDVQNIVMDKIAKNGIVDKDFSKTLILVSFPVYTTTEELRIMIDKINTITEEVDIPYNGRASNIAGQDVVSVQVNDQIMSTQLTSMLTELLLILSALIIGFGSIRIGFLSLIPVLFVLAWEPGSLVFLGIPLSVINVTVAAIIVSSGIDYGIMITQRIKEERAKGLSKTDSLKKTIETSGWSIVTASTTTMVALLATFAVNIPMIHQFSIIIIILYVFSIIASFCILPTVYTSKWFK